MGSMSRLLDIPGTWMWQMRASDVEKYDVPVPKCPGGATHAAAIGMDVTSGELPASVPSSLPDSTETVSGSGFVQVSGRRFHRRKQGRQGRVNTVDADVHYFEVAQRIGTDGFFAMNERQGLDQKHDLPLPGITQCNDRSCAWKQEQHGQGWLIGNKSSAHTGEGFALVSPTDRDILPFARHLGLPSHDAYPALQNGRGGQNVALLSERIRPPDGATPAANRT